MKYKIYILLALFLATVSHSQAQDEVKARKSPMAIATFQEDSTYIKVVYSQPSKRDRDIFGGIVPYDKVWRTGANEATEITITNPIILSGQNIKPGTYSLFTIPGQDEWTIILNKDLGMWGHYSYKSENDLIRLQVDPIESKKSRESFNIRIEDGKKGDKSIQLHWDNTLVIIPFEIAT